MASPRHPFILLIACSVAGSALAQAADPSIEQISSAPLSVNVQANPPEADRSVAPPAQLATDEESSPATSQVSAERRAAPPPDQLSRGPKTAQPPQPLSRPAEGRQSAVERLVGADRCDPAKPNLPRSCAMVIENRSAEFTRPDPNGLSPEQRLLLEQEVREGALDPVRGARRLAVTGDSDQSLAAMGVAAAVMRPKEDAADNDKPNEDVAKAAEIVGAIINQPLNPQPPQ